MARLWRWVALLVGFGSALARAWSASPPPLFAPVPAATAAAAGDEPVYMSTPVSSGATPSVHSASAIELDDGRLLAVWYGGSREGAADVAIYRASFDPGRGVWSNETVVVSREGSAKELRRYLRKLGNPVLSKDRSGRIWLFYVSVSMGGWSGSAVNVRWSDDGGRQFGPARRLVTSPFLNVSTLVKGPAIEYADGSLGVPVYHEFIGKFGELLRVDRAGNVIDKRRLSSGTSSLQPVLAVEDGLHARAFFRRSGWSAPRVLSASTADGGRSWTPMHNTTLPNPDAAIACIRTSSGDLLMAFNDSEVDRSNLSLALSPDDGETFERLGRIEHHTTSIGTPRLSYPWLMQASDGAFHLFYTWDRSEIVHVRFNQAWLSRRR